MLLQGDCLIKLKELADNSIDSIVSDPPYGLSFMGKKWDYDVPTTEIWAECLRVLKPGGHLLAFFGTRTYHRGVVRIEDAGFEIRDQIQWIYGSGFPKSHNIGDGRGTALKPANEPIVVARKPLEKGLTIAENVQKWGTGALNIDASRLESPGRKTGTKAVGDEIEAKPTSFAGSNKRSLQSEYDSKTQGRWPANVIFDEEAAAVLDEQSGISKSTGGGKKAGTKYGSIMGKVSDKDIGQEGYYGDSGGASRFFYVAKASKKERNAGLEGMPIKVLATSNHGQEDAISGRLGANPLARQEPVANHHPTVKPVKLMEYLINLVTPPNGSVLDPFMGSGSTGVAAKNLNREFIGIELNEEYFEIAKKRIGA